MQSSEKKSLTPLARKNILLAKMGIFPNEAIEYAEALLQMPKKKPYKNQAR